MDTPVLAPATIKIEGYGYKRDLVDFRDLFLEASDAVLGNLPPEVDLRTTGWLPEVFDQGQLGSCTANSAAANMEYLAAKLGLPMIQPSRLFIYWNERAVEGTTSIDAGASIRDAIKVTNRYGVCPEAEWPYDISQFAVRPPNSAYADAAKDRVLDYQRVPRLNKYFQAVLAQQLPIQIGFSVYDSFESDVVAQNGMVPLPQTSERLLGGHAVLVVGYRTINGGLYYVCRNSWGAGWGDGGYFYMPAAYLMNKGLASDFWAVDTTNAKAA